MSANFQISVQRDHSHNIPSSHCPLIPTTHLTDTAWEFSLTLIPFCAFLQDSVHVPATALAQRPRALSP